MMKGLFSVDTCTVTKVAKAFMLVTVPFGKIHVS